MQRTKAKGQRSYLDYYVDEFIYFTFRKKAFFIMQGLLKAHINLCLYKAKDPIKSEIIRSLLLPVNKDWPWNI